MGGQLCLSCEGNWRSGSDHCVDDDEELSCDSNEDCLWSLAFEPHAIAHGEECGHAPGGAESRNVESFADLSPTAPDASGAALSTAFTSVGCKTGKGSDFASAKGAEFRPFAEKCGQDGGADARHTDQKPGLGCQRSVLFDKSSDVAIEC